MASWDEVYPCGCSYTLNHGWNLCPKHKAERKDKKNNG